MAEAGGMDAAFQIAKLQAATDGAFDDTLMRHWFNASWELCAEMVGTALAGHVQETVAVDRNGKLRLSGKPSGPVRLYSCGRLVAVLPATSPQFDGSRRNLPNPYDGNGDGASIACSPSLCCYCDLLASYDVGNVDQCGDGPGSARFLQAVVRLFAYICENRGDVEMDEAVLAKCGAKAFLAPDLTYVM